MLRCAQSLSHVRNFVTPWTITLQAPLSLGILQARTLEWVAMLSSRGSSQPRNWPRSPNLQADSLLSEPPGSSSTNLHSVSTCICYYTLTSLVLSMKARVMNWMCPHKIHIVKSQAPVWLYLETFTEVIRIKWSHRSGALIQTIGVIRDTRRAHTPSTIRGCIRKVSVSMTGRNPSPGPELVGPLIWGFQPPEPWEINFLLLKPVSLWCFVMAAWVN